MKFIQKISKSFLAIEFAVRAQLGTSDITIDAIAVESSAASFTEFSVEDDFLEKKEIIFSKDLTPSNTMSVRREKKTAPGSEHETRTGFSSLLDLEGGGSVSVKIAISGAGSLSSMKVSDDVGMKAALRRRTGAQFLFLCVLIEV